jgi:PBSX family phage terminase large subunit
MRPDALSDLSLEQYEFLRDSTARINIAHGPVRSGKNFIENLRMLLYLKSEPHGDPTSDIAFCGTSKDAIFRIFLRDLFALSGPANYTYNRQNGSGTIFGRSFYSFGFRKSDDYERLRGATLGGALLTEATLCHPDFFNEILARLSVDGSKIFLDTNPAGPYHWLYTDYIMNEDLQASGLLKQFGFNFDSNLSLTNEYKDSLKAYYGPGSLWYRRMILGEWCMADGVIYQGFNPDIHTIDKDPVKTDAQYIGMDYGTNNPCVFLDVRRKGQDWFVLNEYYHNGRQDGQKTDTEYGQDIQAFIAEHGKPDKIIYDPSASSFRAEMRKRKIHGLKAADNTVLDGIATVSSLLQAGRLHIHSRCVNTLREFGSYAWDKNAANRGEDKPAKQHDHAMDALRYVLHTMKASKIPTKNNWMS